MNTPVTGIDLLGSAVDGRFPLLEWIGSSGQALIYRTEANGPESATAAIWLIPADLEEDESRIGDWALTADLSHPHLVRQFANGRAQIDDQEILYLVTEMPEESLSQVLPERPLTPTEAGEMLDAMLEALSFLHQKEFVHGQIRPSNVLVVDNRLKLSVDTVRRAGNSAKLSPTTSAYDAPEISDGAITPAADVWSVGVTLVEALTQRLPEWALERDDSANSDPAIGESVPQPFSDIARACLRRDPARRASVDELRALLNPATPVPEPKPIPKASVPDPPAPAQPAPAQPVAPITGSVPASLPHEPVKPSGESAPSKPRNVWYIAAGVLLVIVVAVLFVRSTKTPDVSTTPAPSAAAAPTPAEPTAAAPAATAPAPASAPAPQPPAAKPPATQQESPTAQQPNAKGEVAERVSPDVLPSASRTIHGKVEVVIRVMVDPTGAVSDASFESRGYSQYFANKALDAARKWKFKPARANGEAQSSEWILRFQFRHDGTQVIPVEVKP